MRHSVGVSIPTCNFGGSRFDYRFDMHQPFFLSLQFAEIQQLQDVDETRSLLILIKFKGFFVVGLLTLSSQINLTPPLQQDLFMSNTLPATALQLTDIDFNILLLYLSQLKAPRLSLYFFVVGCSSLTTEH